MSTRRDPAHEGRLLAEQIRRTIGDEIRAARLASGISQTFAARAAGMSHAQLSRIEHARLRDLTFDQACRAGIVVGLRLGARLYPDGDPVRDRAQLGLLGRFRARLPASARWDTEVPLPSPGDRRAWDALVRLGGRRAGCEGETRLHDLQAAERRWRLKLRDGLVDVLIVLVSDTAANRTVLAAHRDWLRALLPLDGRDVHRAFRDGRLPEANALVVL